MKQRRDDQLVKSLVEKLVHSLLKEWLPYRSLPVHVKYYQGGRSRAHVSWHSFKDERGVRKCDKSQIDLCINEESFLNKEISVSSLYKTICHETYHIIQRNIYSEYERNELVQQTVPSNKITTYCDNTLELQAEVFTINICGSSNHSYQNAKNDQLYSTVLREVINMNLF